MAKKAPRRTAERIASVTLDLFNRYGEPHVSTTMISSELGISPGNLYYHFPAKDKLVNALHLGAKIIATLPQARMTPETTSGREGFLMIYEMRGTAAECELRFILRDFELDGLAAKGALLRQVCEAVAATEPRAKITCEIRPQYRNMRYWLEKDMSPVTLAQDACRDLGIEPVSVPIRGGTDGSRLTEMGVPCPNVFTGMQELHGPREWISVQDMALSTRVVLRLVERAAQG